MCSSATRHAVTPPPRTEVIGSNIDYGLNTCVTSPPPRATVPPGPCTHSTSGQCSEWHKATREASGVMAVVQAPSMRRVPPPDGGYGWVVVFGSWVVHFLVLGLQYSCVTRACVRVTPTAAAGVPGLLSRHWLVAQAPTSSARVVR